MHVTYACVSRPHRMHGFAVKLDGSCDDVEGRGGLDERDGEEEDDDDDGAGAGVNSDGARAGAGGRSRRRAHWLEK